VRWRKRNEWEGRFSGEDGGEKRDERGKGAAGWEEGLSWRLLSKRMPRVSMREHSARSLTKGLVRGKAMRKAGFAQKLRREMKRGTLFIYQVPKLGGSGL